MRREKSLSPTNIWIPEHQGCSLALRQGRCPEGMVWCWEGDGMWVHHYCKIWGFYIDVNEDLHLVWQYTVHWLLMLHRSAVCNIPEDLNLQQHCCETLKSHTLNSYWHFWVYSIHFQGLAVQEKFYFVNMAALHISEKSVISYKLTWLYILERLGVTISIIYKINYKIICEFTFILKQIQVWMWENTEFIPNSFMGWIQRYLFLCGHHSHNFCS